MDAQPITTPDPAVAERIADLEARLRALQAEWAADQENLARASLRHRDLVADLREACGALARLLEENAFLRQHCARLEAFEAQVFRAESSAGGDGEHDVWEPPLALLPWPEGASRDQALTVMAGLVNVQFQYRAACGAAAGVTIAGACRGSALEIFDRLFPAAEVTTP